MAEPLPDKKNDIDSDAQSSIRPDFLPNPSAESASKLKDQEEKAEGQNADPTEDVADQEQTAGAAPKQTGWRNNVSPRGGSFAKKAAKLGGLKASGPLIAIAGILGAAIVSLAILFNGAVAPLTFIVNVVDDLNYQTAAYKIRHLVMTRNRLAKRADTSLTSSCSKLSISCRFKTFSKEDIAKFDRAGIKLNYGEAVTTTKTYRINEDGSLGELSGSTKIKKSSNGLNLGEKKTWDTTDLAGQKVRIVTETTFIENEGSATIFGRKRITDAGFGNKTYNSPDALSADIKSGSPVRSAAVLGMDNLAHGDPTWRQKALRFFGFTDMKAKGLRGNPAERASALMNKAGTNNIDDVTFIQVDEDGNPDAAGSKWKINGDNSSDLYSNSQKKSAEKSLKRFKRMNTPLGKAGQTVMSAVNIMGMADAACSIKNMIGYASVAAKSSNSLQMAQYAMPILTMVGKMKAGDISAEDGEALGEFFTKTDGRKKIKTYNLFGEAANNIIIGSVKNENGDEKDGLPEIGVSEIDNPNYGKSVMDQSLLQMSITGKAQPDSITNQQYSLGMDQSRLLQGAVGFADIIDTVLNFGTDNLTCEVVQNWFVRGLGLLAGVGTIAATWGADAAIDVAKGLAITAAFTAISYVINSALSGSLIDDNMEDATIERGAALWGGIASIEARAAQVRGLKPATSVEEVVAYNELRNQLMLDDIALESRNVGALDTSSQYSFASVLLKTIGNFFSNSVDVSSSLGGATTMVTKSIASVATPQRLLAKNVDTDRYNKCKDSEYEKIEVVTDVQCNLVYVMPEEDLELSIDEVVSFMTKYDVSEDSTTGLPEGYEPPTAEADETWFKNMVLGFTDQFVDSNSVGNNDYAKYLEYCVYRELPFGNVYSDNNAIGQAELDWQNGKNCLNPDNQDLKNALRYFRIYTLDKTLLTDDGATT